jgi:hypothetical protein
MATSMLQYQLYGAMEKETEAKRSRGGPVSRMWVGGISTFFATLLALFSLFMIGTASQNAAGTEAAMSSGGCCISVALIMGIAGLCLLVFGWIGKNNADGRISDARAEVKRWQLQIAQEEDAAKEAKHG